MAAARFPVLSNAQKPPAAPEQQVQQLPQLPKEIWLYIFSFLLLSQKKPVVSLSKYYNIYVIRQTRAAIDFHYKKLLTLFITTLGKKYVGPCVSFRDLLLTNLIPPDASNLNLIRNHLVKVKHTIAFEFLSLEGNERKDFMKVVDSEEGPRLRELFKLADFYHQTDAYIDQKKLKEAEIAVLKIPDIKLRSTKLQKLVILHCGLKQYDHATRLSELIPDPEIQKESKLDIMRMRQSSIVYNPDRV